VRREWSGCDIRICKLLLFFIFFFDNCNTSNTHFSSRYAPMLQSPSLYSDGLDYIYLARQSELDPEEVRDYTFSSAVIGEVSAG
jgi:hypothetical protein